MRSKVSQTDIQIWRLVSRDRDRWYTADDISYQLKADGRNVRLHLAYFVELGLLERFSFSKAYRYRWSCKTARSRQYAQRIAKAAEILGTK